MAERPSGEYQAFLLNTLTRIEERIGNHGREFRDDVATLRADIQAVSQKVGAIEGDVRVLTDRSDQDKKEKQAERIRQALWGSGGGLGVLGVIEAIKTFFHQGGGR